MKTIKIGLCMLIAAILSACSLGKDNEGKNLQQIDIHKFKETSLTNQKQQLPNSPLLGIIRSISLVNDSILGMSQANDKNQVFLFNLLNGNQQTAITQGNGPEEMIYPSSLSASGNELWVTGFNDLKVMAVAWNEDGDKADINVPFKLPIDILRGVSDGDGGLYVLPASEEGIRFLHINKSGEPVDTIGEFPASAPTDTPVFNLMYQSDIAYSPKHNKIVSAFLDFNYITITDVASNETIFLEYPIEEKIGLERNERGGGFSYVPKPAWSMFSDVSASKDSFFVGFKGIKLEKREDLLKPMTTILEFDWQGNPLRKFTVDSDIVCFTTSEDGRLLYTIENSPEPTLYKYNISD